MSGRLVAILGALVVAAALAVASTDRPDPTVFERTEHLADQIRCPVCDGVSVADSPSSTARAIWDDIADRVERGQTDAEILDAYAQRYGDWILLTPTRPGTAGVILALPLLAIAVAVIAVGLHGRRQADRTGAQQEPA